MLFGDDVGVSSSWVVSDELWAVVKPLLPVRPAGKTGPKPLDDRLVLQGILFVLITGVGWEDLPPELGFGTGMTCWRRLRSWQEAGVFDELHQVLLARLNAAGGINWSRAIADASHVQAKRGARKQVRRRSIAVRPARNTT